MDVIADEDRRAFRDALGCFATGVTIVTCLDQRGVPTGATASSFNSVSLDPPLILFSLGHHMRTLSAYEASGTFAVNVLREDQEHLSTQFASQAVEDKWADVAHTISDRGCPLIEGALAVFECEAWEKYDGGDHIIFVGRVVRTTADGMRDPLVFYRGKYRALGTVG